MRKLRSWVWCEECGEVHDSLKAGHPCSYRSGKWSPLYTINPVADSYERCQVRYERVQTGERSATTNRPIYSVEATCLCGWTATRTHRREAEQDGRAHARGEL